MGFGFIRRLLRRRAELSVEDAQARRAIIILSIYLVAIFALHIGAMIWFEKMKLGDAVWLTATTVTTVDTTTITAVQVATATTTHVIAACNSLITDAQLTAETVNKLVADSRAQAVAINTLISRLQGVGLLA